MSPLPLLLTTLLLTPPALPPGVTILDTRTRTAVALDVLADELARRDVVVLGEEHDHDRGHAAQLALVRALAARREDIILSLEMFERDAQGPLDDYLAGRLTEAEFLKHARPWPNYADHYRPLVEFARARNAEVIAANVLRRRCRAARRPTRPMPPSSPALPVPRGTLTGTPFAPRWPVTPALGRRATTGQTPPPPVTTPPSV